MDSQGDGRVEIGMRRRVGRIRPTSAINARTAGAGGAGAACSGRQRESSSMSIGWTRLDPVGAFLDEVFQDRVALGR